MNKYKEQNIEDDFDDNFQVGYEDSYDLDATRIFRSSDRDMDSTKPIGTGNTDRPYSNGYSRNYDSHCSRYDDYDDYDDGYDQPAVRETRSRENRKRGASRSGTAARKLTCALLRAAALILTAVIIWLLFTLFRKNMPLYGDIGTIPDNINLTLAGFLCVPAFFILFEIISFFRILSNDKVRTGKGTYRVDRGRGMFSFIFLFICSYLSWQLAAIIPLAPDIVNGLRDGLLLFGTLHRTLFWIGIAGVISCVIRRVSSR